jgi:hypothetical protein
MTDDAVRIVERHDRLLLLIDHWEREVRDRRNRVRRAEHRLELLRREEAALRPEYEARRFEVYSCADDASPEARP